MSMTDEEPIEQLRRNSEALNRGDFDAAVEMADPDIAFVRPGGLPELRGVEAVREGIDSISLWTFNDRGKVIRVEAVLQQDEDAARRALEA